MIPNEEIWRLEWHESQRALHIELADTPPTPGWQILCQGTQAEMELAAECRELAWQIFERC